MTTLLDVLDNTAWVRPGVKSQRSLSCLQELGDNCIQIFHLGRYIVGYTVGNLVGIFLSIRSKSNNVILFDSKYGSERTKFEH